jgi:hypothetical protein
MVGLDILLVAAKRAQGGVKPSNYLTRSRRAGCQHPVPEYLGPGYGVGEFSVLCSAPEPVHFFRADAPCVAIPDVFRSVEGKPQPPGSAADGCLRLVRGRTRFRTSSDKSLGFIYRRGV